MFGGSTPLENHPLNMILFIAHATLKIHSIGDRWLGSCGNPGHDSIRIHSLHPKKPNWHQGKYCTRNTPCVELMWNVNIYGKFTALLVSEHFRSWIVFVVRFRCGCSRLPTIMTGERLCWHNGWHRELSTWHEYRHKIPKMRLLSLWQRLIGIDVAVGAAVACRRYRLLHSKIYKNSIFPFTAIGIDCYFHAIHQTHTTRLQHLASWLFQTKSFTTSGYLSCSHAIDN